MENWKMLSDDCYEHVSGAIVYARGPGEWVIGGFACKEPGINHYRSRAAAMKAALR